MALSRVGWAKDVPYATRHLGRRLVYFPSERKDNK